jgi:hypothetical protein
VTLQNPAEASATAQIDYAPLTARPTSADLADFRQWASRSTFAFPNSWGPRIKSVLTLLAVIAMSLVLLAFGLSIAALTSATFSSPAVAVSFGIGAIALAGFAIYLLVRKLPGTLTFRSPWPRRWRMAVFSRVNGFIYVPRSGEPPIPGSVFGRAQNSIATDRLISRVGQYFEIGNYQRNVADWYGTSTAEWGYIAIDLERALPHIVLKARVGRYRWGNRGIPASFTKDQVLRLEGDFNKYFTLHVPRGYESDALYVHLCARPHGTAHRRGCGA